MINFQQIQNIHVNKMSQRDKLCTVYIAAEDAPMTQQEIQKSLESNKVDDRIKVNYHALKSLVISCINDDQFPRMIMTVINSIVPIQDDSHGLKKIMLFYWEVIEKVQPNGQLKDEMILVCNSLRKDLLHPNEYIRGRTLKLLSRIQYRGILEPLQTAIVENVTHKHIYVRRNAIVCLYEVFLNFGDDLISDLDELMEKLLLNETDLSTKRNAFLLLFHANQNKALEYLNNTLLSQEDTSSFGDILQLSILELFRKVCKLDPSQKPKLLKSIFHFTKSKSPSVLYECANTLCAVSLTNHSLKLALTIYMQLINSQTDNNVKLVVLDRLEVIKESNQRVIEERILDIASLLSQQSVDIRRKVLTLIQKLVRVEAVPQIIQALQKELSKIQNESDQVAHEFRLSLLQTILHMTVQFPAIHDSATQIIIDSVLLNSKIDDNSALVASQIMTVLIKANNQSKLVAAIQNKFFDIAHIQIYKSALWILSLYSEDPIKSFNQIKRAIGSLPLELEKPKQQSQEEETQVKKTKVKTVILPDGTYGTQIVEESSNSQNQEANSKLREYLMKNSFIASSLARTLMRLLNQILDQPEIYNKFASQSLLIFCALIRYFQSNLVNIVYLIILYFKQKVDQETIEKIYYAVRILTSSQENLKEAFQHYIQTNDFDQQEFNQNELVEQMSVQEKGQTHKQPDDSLVIRQLKQLTNDYQFANRGKQQGINEIDLADEESNELFIAVTKEEDSFVSRLNHIVQLTGYSDPIYAEAFVKIHKYDIQFDVFFINRSAKMVQNVQIEFRTQGESKVLEKAQGVTLQPNQNARVKITLKFSSSDLGMIYGAINYENNAGVEQAYLVTKEINIDLIDFIYPAVIDIESFRKNWAKYEWENRISINTNIKELGQFIRHIEKQLKMRQVQEISQSQNLNVVCVNLYARTKLDDDFLINISADNCDSKISGYIRIRSKVKGIVVNLGEKIKAIQNRVD